MQHLITNLTEKHWRTVQNVAHQIAGRKARRSHHHFNIPREMQDRRRQSPFKDIASSAKHQIAAWIEEDGHHHDHVANAHGGSLSNAMRHVLHTAHHIYQRENRTGGGLPNGIKRLGTMLHHAGKSLGVQADVASDQFLNKVGIRKELKYKSAENNDQLRFHAKLNREVYKENRGDVGDYKYSHDDSTKDFGVWKHEGEGKAMVVFRGTDPSKAHLNNDLIDDARIATGLTKEFTTNDAAQMKIKELLNKHGDHHVSVSGYSLGGGRMLQAISSGGIYDRLGNNNFALAPGLTSVHPQFERFANFSKIQYAYHHNDAVANSLLAKKDDRHHVFYDEANPIKAHLFLDKLADS